MVLVTGGDVAPGVVRPGDPADGRAAGGGVVARYRFQPALLVVGPLNASVGSGD